MTHCSRVRHNAIRLIMLLPPSDHVARNNDIAITSMMYNDMLTTPTAAAEQAWRNNDKPVTNNVTSNQQCNGQY